ncbi:class I SAM-dependent methyltransferase [Sulfitobacter sp. SK012]|uniref:class I SAM-dependent DNA methyltransferase n=1 Tax=Sulfitobacter sp. SK012 TaxID=1389005 RepID=UPI000E0AC5AC|nr:class I SAM-dependent methyltransferase [Sulfitobacter sp. SK012]AXI48459.1 class I SAM-dependent methyltransferase [Sulfitobacter sp. SK012]
MPHKTPDLDAAYAVETPDENRALYRDWAGSYDAEFAKDMDYRLPQLVALVFAEQMNGLGPVLDVGAGTGLVVENIPVRATFEIDALDISPDMLGVAMKKGLYRTAIEADLTHPLDIKDGIYGAVISAGTFTHGHVGPEAMKELLRVARTRALFVLAINAEHYVSLGFAAAFEALETQLTDFELRTVHIYGSDATDAHKNDQARIATFRKC